VGEGGTKFEKTWKRDRGLGHITSRKALGAITPSIHFAKS